MHVANGWGWGEGVGQRDGNTLYTQTRAVSPRAVSHPRGAPFGLVPCDHYFCSNGIFLLSSSGRPSRPLPNPRSSIWRSQRPSSRYSQCMQLPPRRPRSARCPPTPRLPSPSRHPRRVPLPRAPHRRRRLSLHALAPPFSSPPLAKRLARPPNRRYRLAPSHKLKRRHPIRQRLMPRTAVGGAHIAAEAACCLRCACRPRDPG